MTYAPEPGVMRKRRPRRVAREVFDRDADNAWQPALCEYRADSPVSQFITPDGVIAFPANDIALCTALWNAIQEGAR